MSCQHCFCSAFCIILFYRLHHALLCAPCPGVPRTCHPKANESGRSALSGKERLCLCSLCDLQEISVFPLWFGFTPALDLFYTGQANVSTPSDSTRIPLLLCSILAGCIQALHHLLLLPPLLAPSVSLSSAGWCCSVCSVQLQCQHCCSTGTKRQGTCAGGCHTTHSAVFGDKKAAVMALIPPSGHPVTGSGAEEEAGSPGQQRRGWLVSPACSAVLAILRPVQLLGWPQRRAEVMNSAGWEHKLSEAGLSFSVFTWR